jgi:regulator of sirC expression with transglutaminase-like and TPR domain
VGLQFDPELALFSHMVARPEPDIDLAQACLLIARTEYADLDVTRYTAVIDSLGDDAKRVLAKKRAGDPAERFVRWMFDDVGFQGNAVDYYDPKNSYLNDVIERRKGIPISLAVLLLEVGRRAGIALAGVSFPGHFLLRSAPGKSERMLVIDPFDGQKLGRKELRELHARAIGEERDPEPALLAPATKRQILVRMLNNLRGIYATRGDRMRLRGVLERMSVLVRSEELRRQLEQVGGRTPWPSGGHVLN